jgi:hypothetical protein
VLLAVVDYFFVLAVAEVVEVLDADDVDDLAGFFDLGDLDLAEAYVTDLALFLEALDDSEGILDGDLGVDAVELPEVEALELEAAEAHLDLLVEVFGAGDGEPLVGALAGEAGLGGDDDALGVGGEGLADETLGDLGAVGVGGIDEVDTQFDGSLEDFFGGLGIFGFAPDAFAGDSHGSVSEAMDGEVTA